MKIPGTIVSLRKSSVTMKDHAVLRFIDSGLGDLKVPGKIKGKWISIPGLGDFNVGGIIMIELTKAVS